MSARPAGLVVRPMTAGDVDWAKELADGEAEAPHWPRTAYLAAADPQHEPRRMAVVAEVQTHRPEGELRRASVGFAVASLVPPQAELETIVVAAPARRSGIGRALLVSLIDRLKQANVTEVMLEVRASNVTAAVFYRALGFAESGRRIRYYIDPIEDAVLMRLPLRG